MRVVALVAILSVSCAASPGITNTKSTELRSSVTTAAPAVAQTTAKPTFVEFYTTWCAPCKQMEPVIYKLEDEYSNRVDFKILDAAGATAEKQKYKYVSQPQVVFVNSKGEIVNTLYGFQGYDALKKQLDSLLALQ
jgi:thioredoxin 1